MVDDGALPPLELGLLDPAVRGHDDDEADRADEDADEGDARQHARGAAHFQPGFERRKAVGGHGIFDGWLLRWNGQRRRGGAGHGM